MKKRVIVLGIAVGLVCIAAMDRAMALWRHDVPIGAPLDLSAISKLRVDGAASLISVTTDPDTPLTATLTGERDGWGSLWQSGWHARDCSDSGRMHIDDDTLVVDVADMSRYFDWSDCTIKLNANLRPQSAVLIRQKAARIGLDGDFSTVNVRADAGDFTLDGHASTLDVSGAALRVQAFFKTISKDETILLSGRMMDATLRFITPTSISYLVEATASYIDSALPNTPGAHPAITIRGEMVRARIE
ncbi:hypothetical protein RvVAT039_25590 [Agrobacterium vitis]|uniref:hypothetical protein n=1 Tax=Agrobacterium vitis TaxID=373 RepID=UPI0015DAF499|nr:hypothetical protein [Agrobacterium vitis]BCH65343.1 hypothetical protein RvVAT039_25590 [Agrobacterium vitis]